MTDQPRPRVTHELKTWPEFFQATTNGRKKFELRRDDRGGFQVGDQLLLKEWNPISHEIADDGLTRHAPAYTGREVLVRVDYVMSPANVDALVGRGSYPLNFVIMSISRVH